MLRGRHNWKVSMVFSISATCTCEGVVFRDLCVLEGWTVQRKEESNRGTKVLGAMWPSIRSI